MNIIILNLDIQRMRGPAFSCTWLRLRVWWMALDGSVGRRHEHPRTRERDIAIGSTESTPSNTIAFASCGRLDPRPSAEAARDNTSQSVSSQSSQSVQGSQSQTTLRECVDFLRCSRGLNSSTRVASSCSRSNTQSLFQPLRHARRPFKQRPYYRKKWQHEFVCLSQVGQFIPPDTVDRVRLAQAGLGVSCDYDSGVDELHQELLSTFPPLRGGGGYEFLKLDEASRRHLSVVPPPTGGYSPVYLKAVFLQAKIFIRPLQKNLDLTPTADKEVCILLVQC